MQRAAVQPIPTCSPTFTPLVAVSENVEDLGTGAQAFEHVLVVGAGLSNSS